MWSRCREVEQSRRMLPWKPAAPRGKEAHVWIVGSVELETGRIDR